jgi:hypothetical protein
MCGGDEIYCHCHGQSKLSIKQIVICIYIILMSYKYCLLVMVVDLKPVYV